MPRTNNKISNEVRRIIINSHINGMPISIIATNHQLPESTIRSMVRKYLTTSQIEKSTNRHVRERILNDEEVQRLMSWIQEDCTISLRSLVERCLSEFNKVISKSTIENYISGFQFSLKAISLSPERRNTPENIETRYRFAIKYIDILGHYGPTEIIFIDEVGFNVSMRNSRGRSLAGTPAIMRVPNVRTRNLSFCAAMCSQGLIPFVEEIEHSTRKNLSSS